MTSAILGIDVSKRKFDVALLKDGKFKTKVFDNTDQGFVALSDWLGRHGAGRVHACLEATGRYGEALATALFDAGHRVSIVNPAQVKGFGMSELTRTKTDKADARLIARFCTAHQPPPWQPAPAHVRDLQAWVRRLDSLLDLKQQELNRLDTAFDVVRPSIHAVVATLDSQIAEVRRLIRDHIDRHPDLRDKQRLLQSIPGVGEATIAQVLAFFGEVSRFAKAKQLAAFIGVNPRQHLSGSSVTTKTRLSKTGAANLRRMLYMPAIVAMTHNPIVKAFCQRLKRAGKPVMAIIGAVMRKLVHIIYGVLKSRRPFDPTLAVA
jgi:transposase